jgi:hypothetical protein
MELWLKLARTCDLSVMLCASIFEMAAMTAALHVTVALAESAIVMFCFFMIEVNATECLQSKPVMPSDDEARVRPGSRFRRTASDIV